nr:hypothetical protein [uncultured Cohaesibacter sp.]
MIRASEYNPPEGIICDSIAAETSDICVWGGEPSYQNTLEKYFEKSQKDGVEKNFSNLLHHSLPEHQAKTIEALTLRQVDWISAAKNLRWLVLVTKSTPKNEISEQVVREFSEQIATIPRPKLFSGLILRGNEQLVDSEPMAHVVHEAAKEFGKPSKLKRKFCPSKQLLEAWISGRNALAAQLDDVDTIRIEEVLKNDECALELSNTIHNVISGFGKRKSYKSGTEVIISFGSKMDPLLEAILSDRLMLPPRLDSKFLSLLTEEIKAQSYDGPIFEGRWGRLVLDQTRNELLMQVKKRSRRKFEEIIKRCP